MTSSARSHKAPVEPQGRELARVPGGAHRSSDTSTPLATIAAAAAIAAALAMFAGDGLAQVAGSEAAAGKVLAVAIGAEAAGTADRPGARALDGGIELRPLLAQNTTAAAADAQERGDTVLVTFPLATPRDVEEDVARQHGVEIVERWDSTKQRVIQVRVPPGRSAEAVLAALRRDGRVQGAQAIHIYRPAAAHAAVEPEAAAAAKPKGASPAPASPAEGIAAALAPGGPPKSAPPQRKALGARTHKAAVPVISASAPAGPRWVASEELFVGADGRLR
jgi:hypothetical protein